jgi:DNA anti-recombination protein RmuC
MNEENLTPRVGNIELLIEYMAQTQREVTGTQELLTHLTQKGNLGFYLDKSS